MDRQELIQQALREGKSLKEIGRLLGGVSRQRVYQLMDRYSIETPEYKKKGYWKTQPAKAKWLQRTMNSKNLSAEERLALQAKFLNSWPEVCPVLGIPLVYGNLGTRKDDSASLDQIAPGKGYTPDNVAIISWRANQIKNNGTAEEHLKIYEWLTQNLLA